MPFSTKHIAFSVLGSTAVANAEGSRPSKDQEETVDASNNKNPFVPRRLYQENNLDTLDSITRDDVQISLHLDKGLLNNGKESTLAAGILPDHAIQDSSSSDRHDIGILPDKRSQEVHRIRRRLAPATTKSTKAPKGKGAPSVAPEPTTKKPKSCKGGSCAPSSMPSAFPSESAAPSYMPSTSPSGSFRCGWTEAEANRAFIPRPNSDNCDNSYYCNVSTCNDCVETCMNGECSNQPTCCTLCEYYSAVCTYGSFSSCND